MPNSQISPPATNTKLIHLKISLVRSCAALPPSSAACTLTTTNKHRKQQAHDNWKSRRIMSLSCRAAGRPLWWNLQNAPCNFRGELRDAGFDVAPGGARIPAQRAVSPWRLRPAALPRASFNNRGAIIEQFLASGFLLGVNLGARLPQSFLVLLDFFRGGGLRGFRGFARAGGSRFALGHHFQQRLEKQHPQNDVKNEKDQDCRHSLKEQFAKLVNNLLHLACVA